MVVDTPGYTFDAAEFARLLILKSYPERTDRESAVIRDFLMAHLHEFSRVEFSVRVGQGQAPDPAHLDGVQANTVFSSKKRIDLLCWRGPIPVLVEAKERVQPGALGQIQTYRNLFLEEHPDAPEPELVVIGRYSDADTLPSLSAAGVTVYLYAPADPAGVPGPSGV